MLYLNTTEEIGVIKKKKLDRKAVFELKVLRIVMYKIHTQATPANACGSKIENGESPNIRADKDENQTEYGGLSTDIKLPESILAKKKDLQLFVPA